MRVLIASGRTLAFTLGNGKPFLLNNSEDWATLGSNSSRATGGYGSPSAFSFAFVLHSAIVSTTPY